MDRKFLLTLYFFALALSLLKSIYEPEILIGSNLREIKNPKNELHRKSSPRRPASINANDDYGINIDQKYNFLDLAYVDTSPCSLDYSIIDDCYNEKNPPQPSIIRNLKKPLIDSSEMIFYPGQNYVTGKAMALPNERSSNDGRLLLFRSLSNGNPSLSIFRPELMGFDYKVINKDLKPTSPHTEIHPLVYFNPSKTSLHNLPSTGTQGIMLPNFHHFTMCDDSGAAFTPGPPAQISKNRNPFTCKARYSNQDDFKIGDCYNISLMIAPDTANHPENPAKWEIRTSDITVFVPNAKTVKAGEKMIFDESSTHLWIYPRQNMNTMTNIKTLPNYEDFDLHKIISWETGIQDSKTTCYNGSERKPRSPKWCQFFDEQSYSKNGFDVYNFNSPDSGYFHWTGEQCGDPSKGCKGYYFFEPSITADGRLLVVNTMASMAYSYNSLGACKAEGWSKFDSIANLPFDPLINTRYAIGKNQIKDGVIQPFRDTSGKDIPSYAAMKGAYGWIDREGKNLFYAQQNLKRDGYKAVDESGEPWEFEDAELPYGQAQDLNPDQGPGKNVTIIGAWTQGKMVIPDGVLNFSDFGGRRSQNGRMNYELALYDSTSLTSTRPAGSFSIFSFENQFNYFQALSPVLPFDVVWSVASDNQGNSEIVFDEYLMNNAFVVAHMNAPVDRVSGYPQDGFESDGSFEDGIPSGFKYRKSPLLQNAATTHSFYAQSSLQVPSVLRLRGGARVEPMASGGIKGKGVYLDGFNDFIDMGYPIPEDRNDWFLGIWLDNRAVRDDSPRTIFSFPEGSRVSLSKSKIHLYNPFEQNLDQKERELPISLLVETNKYFHLGLKITTRGNNRVVKVYVNGTPLIVNDKAEQIFEISDINDPFTYGFQPFDNYLNNGWTWFAIGDPGFGNEKPFKGWIDEFRMYSLSSNDKARPWFEEFICNLAYGTLVDVAYMQDESLTPRLSDLRALALNHGLNIADKVDDYHYNLESNHKKISTAVCEQIKLESYNEFVDFSAQHDSGAICIDKVHRSLNNSETSSERCLRQKKLGVIAKKLVPNKPRPDFSQVNFCLSCHSDNASLNSLNISALEKDKYTFRFRDHRRQPMDVPATLYGSTPEAVSWIDIFELNSSKEHMESNQPSCFQRSLNQVQNSCIPMDEIFDKNEKLPPML